MLAQALAMSLLSCSACPRSGCSSYPSAYTLPQPLSPLLPAPLALAGLCSCPSMALPHRLSGLGLILVFAVGDGAPVSSAKLIFEPDPTPAHYALSASADVERDEGGQHPLPTVFLSWMAWVFPLPQAERVMPLQTFGFFEPKKRVDSGNTQGNIRGSWSALTPMARC